MKVILPFLVFSVLIVSCRNEAPSIVENVPESTKSGLPQVAENEAKNHIWYPFADSAYQISLNIFDTSKSVVYDDRILNAVVSFKKQSTGEETLLFTDSLHCQDGSIEYADMNNDQVHDVLIFHSSGGRANPTFHLYVTDSSSKTIHSIKGFTDLPNPELDKENNIIISTGLAGQGYSYSFHRINRKRMLVNLGHQYFTKNLELDSVSIVVSSIIKKFGR
jgi:hypothetical protein